MQLMHVKLSNHEDVLTYIEISEKDDKVFVFTSPVSVHIDPDRGIYARNWLVFSENNYVNIDANAILFISKANDYAVKYHNEFIKKMTKKNDNSYDEDDLEEMFTSMLESKESTKH